MAVTPNRPPGARSLLKRFARYLITHGILTQEQLHQVLKFQAEIDCRIGQLAALKGYMTPADVITILTKQSEIDMRFGQLAVKEGLLSHEQVDALLELQNNPFKLFLECMIFSRVMPEEGLRPILIDFLNPKSTPVEARDVAAAEEKTVAKKELEKDFYHISRDKVQAVIKRIKGFSTLPDVVQRILALLADPEVVIDDVAKVIESDPPLSARMLKLVNSSFFSQRTKINTVHKAVVTLGIRGVKQMVMTASLMHKFENINEENARSLWYHSFLTAQWARALFQARGFRGDDVEDASMAGLLHDSGRFIILENFQHASRQIENGVARGMRRLKAEEHALSMPHTQLGSFLCHYWKFPPGITQAIIYHHSSPAVLAAIHNKEAITDTVNAACRLAHLKLADASDTELDCDAINGLDEEFLDYHDLRPGDIYALSTNVLQEARETMAFIFQNASVASS